MKKYQLIIVGGGPGGYTAAFRAAELGMSVAIVDDNDLGGVCLNWGCIPTKSLLKNAEVFELINNASSYGIEVGKPKLHFEKVIDKTIQARKRLSKGLHFQVRKLGVDFSQVLQHSLTKIQLKLMEIPFMVRHLSLLQVPKQNIYSL